MDLLDLAVLALRVGIVLLLYVFLFAVLRAARWSLAEASPPPLASAEPPLATAERPLASPAAPPTAGPARGERPQPRVSGGARLSLRLVDGVVDGLAPGDVVAVAPGSVIGRARDADLSLLHATVSGRHAEVAWRRGHWQVRDLGSTNGTFLNERPVAAATEVRTGDRLRLGAVTLEVL